MAPAETTPTAPVVAGGQGDANAAQEGQEGQGFFSGTMGRMMLQMFLFTTVMNIFTSRNSQQQRPAPAPGEGGQAEQQMPSLPVTFRNLYGPLEDCDLIVHCSSHAQTPSLLAALNESYGAEQGYELLWHQGVWYETNALQVTKNVSVGPIPTEALAEGAKPKLFLHATLLKRNLLESLKTSGSTIPDEEIVQSSLPLIIELRELDADAGAANLFGGDEDDAGIPQPKRNLSRPKVPYFKTKVEIKPVFDQSVINAGSTQQGPFKRLVKFPELGVYQPYLYISDFWMLEKDYVPLNSTLADRKLNLTLTYSVSSLFAWSVQVQMAEQWMVQGEWGLTDTQRDSFMLKRLYLDTNPYFLAFSAAFLCLHTVFSMLAFKNDIQFWRKNESMQGLSARSMIVSFVCQLITALYLLDSQETSRLILFEIILDTGLAFWKLRKAVKIELTKTFPFISLAGQKGYEEAGTNKYDEEALRYMFAITTPLFVGYALRSALYGKHRGWYSFLVSTAAGGVYTFGFVMMTPQLYINYKLKSVEHLPWRALTYKAMNTFVDDVAAFLIDMPIMHRLSCFRDDIVFFVYIYQRWKYAVDKTRPSVWGEQEGIEGSGQASPALPAADAVPAAEAAGGSAGGEATEAVATDADAGDSGLRQRKT